MANESIARLRQMFEDEIANNADLYHSIDIERVRTEDWQVKRFLLDQPDMDEKKAFDNLCKALQWKKSFGVHDRTDQSFPKEFWELNSVEIYGRDNENRIIQWELYRNQRTFPELNDITRQFISHCLERVDRTAGEDGFIIITDSNGAGLANVDMDVARYKISIIDYYPGGLRGQYVIDLPWLLNAAFKIILSFMSERLKKIVSTMKSNELSKCVDSKFIPVCLGGTREKNAFPNDLIPLDQHSSLNLSEQFLDRFYKLHKLPRPRKM